MLPQFNATAESRGNMMHPSLPTHKLGDVHVCSAKSTLCLSPNSPLFRKD